MNTPSTIFNPELLKIAHVQVNKEAFVDPAAASAGGMADPMAGAMPPMPGMGGAEAGGDPLAAGAPPPADPLADPLAGAAPEAGAGVTADEVRAIVQEAVAGLGGAGGAGGAGGEKMKVDVNTEIYHIKKLLVRMAGELGIKIDPQMLLGDPASDPAVPMEQAAQDPESAAASMAGSSSINPIGGIQGASPALVTGEGQKAASSLEHGHAFDDTGLQINNDKAAALLRQLKPAAA